MHQSILDGTEALRHDGFTYLPKFVTAAETEALLQLCGSLHPLWEERYLGETAGRQGQRSRGLTRPVYWLGAWQFAALRH